MNFYDKITGNDMNKQQKNFNFVLISYPLATKMRGANTIKRSGATVIFWKKSVPYLGRDRRSFEESAAEKLPINSVIGENMTTFISEIAEAAGAKMSETNCENT